MSIRRLFRRKSLRSVLAETHEGPHALRRVLGPVDLSLLGIGGIIGAGIFALVGTAAAGIVAFGSLVAHTAVLLVFQLGQPRILFSMARDGLLPPSLSKTHPRFRTPHVATILTGVFVAVGSALASLEEMADLCNIGTLSAFLIVCIGVIVLRRREPDRPRGFRTPWVPWVPLLGILAYLWLMLGLPTTAWIKFAVWLAAGIAFYGFYGFRRSRLGRG